MWNSSAPGTRRAAPSCAVPWKQQASASTTAGFALLVGHPGRDGRASIDWLAERGILAAPGDFYGPTSHDHVRLSMTATDERINAAAGRLTS